MKDISKDKRYTQNIECCGQAGAKYIARFCGEWISCHDTKEEALTACQEAYENRIKKLPSTIYFPTKYK